MYLSTKSLFIVKQFQAIVLLYTPWKHQKSFFDIAMGYKKALLTWNISNQKSQIVMVFALVA